MAEVLRRGNPFFMKPTRIKLSKCYSWEQISFHSAFLFPFLLILLFIWFSLKRCSVASSGEGADCNHPSSHLGNTMKGEAHSNGQVILLQTPENILFC